jgi:hypothetical protein
VEQLLDVSIAQLNATPSAGVSYLSPLETLSYFLQDAERAFLVRRLPAAMTDVARTIACKVTATVRGGHKAGRRPYVQLDKVKYSSPVLANAGQLVGKTLIIEIDEEDYRQVRTFLKNGAELGILKAQGKWSLSKHSRRTRKIINNLIARRILVLSEFDDPVQAYMRYLSTSKKGETTPRPKQTTELTRVAREAGVQPRLYSKARSAQAKLDIPEVPASSSTLFSSAPLLDSADDFFKKVKNRR